MRKYSSVSQAFPKMPGVSSHLETAKSACLNDESMGLHNFSSYTFSVENDTFSEGN